MKSFIKKFLKGKDRKALEMHRLGDNPICSAALHPVTSRKSAIARDAEYYRLRNMRNSGGEFDDSR